MKKSFAPILLMICTILLFSSCDDKISGTWKLCEIKTEEVPGGQPKFISGPLFMTWEAPEDVVLGFFKVTDIPCHGLVPMGNSKIAQQLKDITFQKDGNIVVTYALPSEDQQKTPTWKKSEPGIATYKIVGDQIMIIPNIDPLIAALPADSLKHNAFLQEAIEFLKNGIPVNYKIEGNTAKLFIDKALIEKIFSFALAGIDHAIPANMSSMKPLINGFLQGIPSALQKTTKIEIGLNLEK